MSEKGVSRTFPATPGLFNIHEGIWTINYWRQHAGQDIPHLTGRKRMFIFICFYSFFTKEKQVLIFVNYL